MEQESLSMLIWLFCIISETSSNIELGQFNNRCSVYMSYSAPAKTRVSLDLLEKNGNIGLHVNPRYKDDSSCNGRSALILNSAVSGMWQTETRPAGFLFLSNRRTSMVIVPQTLRYAIFFDFGSKSQTFTFPYTKGHNPTLVTKILGKSGSFCSKFAQAKIFEVSLGYTLPSLGLESAIYVYATAPSEGSLSIDISMGLPQERDDSQVALRIEAIFGTKPQILLQDQVKGAFKTRETLGNSIQKGGKFSMSIILLRSSYHLAVSGRYLATYPSRISTLCKHQATLWISGATAIERIITY